MYYKYLFPAKILILILFMPVSAMATPEAEIFIRDKASVVLTILSNAELDEVEKERQFRGKILKITNIKVIARFVLGKYAASASKQELEDFTNAFRTYAVRVYQSELGRFGSEIVAIDSSVDRRPGDYVVMTTVTGGAMKKKVRDIKWRVIMIKDSFHVVDMEVAGVWLSQHQRSEITSILNRNNGDISVAIAILDEKNAEP